MVVKGQCADHIFGIRIRYTYIDSLNSDLYPEQVVSYQTQSNSARHRMGIVATVGAYGLVVLLSVLLRLMPETAAFRPMLLFAARYTSLIVRALGFLVFAALWNAAGRTLISTSLLDTLTRTSPIRSLVGAVLVGPFVGTGRIAEAAEVEIGRTRAGASTSEISNCTDDRDWLSERQLLTANPNFAVVLLLSATAFHPAQLTSLVWFLRESIGAAILVFAFAAFVVTATAVFSELFAAGGVLGNLTERSEYAPGRPVSVNRASRTDSTPDHTANRTGTNRTGTEGSGGGLNMPVSEIVTRFAAASGAELYHALRVFILTGLVALAIHVVTPLSISQWLHANPSVAILIAAVSAVILTPPVGGAAAVAVLFRGQIPLVAVFSFLLVALTVRGGNLLAMKRIAGRKYAAVIGGIVILLIAVLLFPIADLIGHSRVPV